MKFNNIEKQIKDQIEQREIAPSKNLWEAIEQEIHIEQPKKSNNNIIWMVAASFVILFGIGFIFMNTPNEEKPTIVKTENSIPAQKVNNQEENLNITSPQKLENSVKKEENINSQKIAETKTINSIEPSKTISPAPLDIKLNTQELQKERENISKNTLALGQDSTKTKSKVVRKKYTDANALLFSVENKDAIKETKDGSNVAKIEFEKK